MNMLGRLRLNACTTRTKRIQRQINRNMNGVIEKERMDERERGGERARGKEKKLENERKQKRTHCVRLKQHTSNFLIRWLIPYSAQFFHTPVYLLLYQLNECHSMDLVYWSLSSVSHCNRHSEPSPANNNFTKYVLFRYIFHSQIRCCCCCWMFSICYRVVHWDSRSRPYHNNDLWFFIL